MSEPQMADDDEDDEDLDRLLRQYAKEHDEVQRMEERLSDKAEEAAKIKREHLALEMNLSLARKRLDSTKRILISCVRDEV